MKQNHTVRVLLSALVLAFVTNAPLWARIITVDEAREAALQFIASGQQAAALRGMTAADASQQTATDAQQTAASSQQTADAQPAASHLTLLDAQPSPACIIFNRTTGDGQEAGYVIVAADDVCSHSILGYSDSGSIDPQHMAPALREWLDGIAEETALARAAGVSARRRSAEAPGNVVVEPLIATRWGQFNPYNNLCPTLDGTRCVTGCVATAMAQLMRYYQWPAKGKGSITYTDEQGCGQEISVDFSQSIYDWANMLDKYDASSSAAQQQAVAVLMRDCGASIQMHYTPETSAANLGMVARALKTYFGYSATSIPIYRNNFDDETWDQLLRAELDQKRPVIYDGFTETVGHAFVCDGYDDAGYFHFNFGWDGGSDGWFLSSANVGYSHNQCMIFKAYPDYEGGGNEEGKEQEEFSWTLSEDSVLTILGKGVMPADYTQDGAPWLQPNDGTYNSIQQAKDKVKKVVIGKGIQNVARELFRQYRSLTTVVLPEGLLTIDFYSFGYSAVEQVDFPSTLLSIEDYAFCNTPLQAVIIPSSTTNIGTGAFTGCTRMGDYEVEQGNLACRSIDGALYNYKGEILRSLPGSRDLYIVPEGVTTFASYSLGGTNLTSFVVPEHITLQSETFRQSLKLESLTLPSTLTEIPYGLCMYCNNLSDCPIPEGVTVIKAYAFQACAFTTVTLPAALTEVQGYAFQACRNLYNIRCKAPQAPLLTGLREWTFEQLPEGGTLTVPTGSDYSSWLELLPKGWTIAYTDNFDDLVDEHVDWAYDASTATLSITGNGHMVWDYQRCPWAEYANDIRHLVIGEGVLNIPDWMFNDMKLESVTIGEGLTSIGMYAFYYCQQLTSLSLPESLKSIGISAFSATGLIDVTLPAHLEALGDKAFAYDNHLATVRSHSATAPEIIIDAEYSGPFRYGSESGRLIVPADGDCSSWEALLPEGWVFIPSDDVDHETAGTWGWTFDKATGVLDIQGAGIMPAAYTVQNGDWTDFKANIRHLVIHDWVMGLPFMSFYQCDRLETVILPASLRTICYGTFLYCTRLSSITCYAPVAPDVSEGDVFTYVADKGILYVPRDADYSEWLQRLPKGWTLCAIEDVPAAITPLEATLPEATLPESPLTAAAATATATYDLYGRPVRHPHPGIVIRNGHKIVVR